MREKTRIRWSVLSCGTYLGVEGNLIIPDSWVTSKWDSRWEDWVNSRRDLGSRHPSF